MKDAFVYISGPITPKFGYIVEENVAEAVKIFLRLLRCGIPAFAPQMCGAFPSCFDVEHKTWLAYDFAVIKRCTHMLMLPRWETSAGAVAEKHYAESLGMPILYSVEDLESLVSTGQTLAERL